MGGVFTLEALAAKHGDALLLHYGDAAAPDLVVIDGGPSGVYRKRLKPRLTALRAERGLTGSQALRPSLMMVSHIDDDHIRGLLDLTDDLLEPGHARYLKPDLIWHNSFQDLTGGDPSALAAALTAAFPAELAAASADVYPDGLCLMQHSAAVLASVAQGNRFRANTLKLGWNLDSAVFAPEAGVTRVDLGQGLCLTLLGPRMERVAALRAEWTKLAAKGAPQTAEARAEAAALLDESVYNLSSLIVLAEFGGRTMLLTGDARADDIELGLSQTGLATSGKLHVDLLKMPHHGSDRNMTEEFLAACTADHYVISANGMYHNPDRCLLKMLVAARGDAEYTIHLTNPVPDAVEYLETQQQAGRRFKLKVRQDPALSVAVPLAPGVI